MLIASNSRVSLQFARSVFLDDRATPVTTHKLKISPEIYRWNVQRWDKSCADPGGGVNHLGKVNGSEALAFARGIFLFFCFLSLHETGSSQDEPKSDHREQDTAVEKVGGRLISGTR